MNMITLLMKRMYWFHEALQNALEPNGIKPLTRSHSYVVANIALGENNASNIARNLGVSRQAISQLMSELEREGYIELIRNPADKRSKIARFRPGFAEEGEACARIFETLEKELGQRIGQRRLNNLRESLEAEWGEPPRLGKVPKNEPILTLPDIELHSKRRA